MGSLEKQLGISPSVEMPVGSKPPTSREKFVRQILTDREDEFTDQTTFRYVFPHSTTKLVLNFSYFEKRASMFEEFKMFLQT